MKNHSQNKGIVLVISLVVMAVLLVLTGAYFSSLLTEKRAADNERSLLAALGLAEAGSNHAVAELRKIIRTDLKNNLETTPKTVAASQMYNLFTVQNPLGLLQNYAGFTVANGQATLSITALNLNTAIQGSYNAVITLTPQALTQNPANPGSDHYKFYYNYSRTPQSSQMPLIASLTWCPPKAALLKYCRQSQFK